MNRQAVLRASLMGEHFDADQKKVDWALNHKPLMSPSIFTITGRYLNHFCVGSDPEFCFRDEYNHRVEAVACGLKVGLAAGADQNERLVELRPWPSVSVVEHMAGILTALRWLHRVFNQATSRYLWRAGAYFAGDGIGGHIHFGRKRPTRIEEVAALDGLANVLKLSGLFPVTEWAQRMRGDHYHNAPYGLPGDWRVQLHGYEYRSLPSWLQSPTVAFIAVASSKLAILDPAITTTWKQLILTETTARNQLRGLAKLYKGRDDDAYILYYILTRNGDAPFNVDYAGDFAPSWGIPRPAAPLEADGGVILPSCIQPLPEEINEMRDHLLFGVPLTFTLHPPNFKTSIPNCYRWLPVYVNPGRRSGFGDLLHNLVGHRNFDLYWDYNNDGNFRITGKLTTLWTTAEKEMLRRYYPGVIISSSSRDSGSGLLIPKCLCQTATIAGLRAILLNSGLFPLWTVETVEADSFAKWFATKKELVASRVWRTV
jgi:hypothetical protein